VVTAARSASARRGAGLAAVLATAFSIAGCGAAPPTDPPAPRGALLVGFLRQGTTRRVPEPPAGKPGFPPLLVSTAGQRGLLSLARIGDRIYAAWTTLARRLVVGRLRAGAAPVIVWRGFPTTTLANGGHLAASPDGRLVVSIGDRQSGRPVGRLLSLDAQGPANQRARTLSSGWNNPFAFTFTPDGRLWVADNAPGRQPERLARGDTAGGPPGDATTLDRRPAASGLAAISSRALALCGVVSGKLDRYELGGDGRWRYVRTLARGCRYGVVRLTDGRLAFSADDGIRVVRP